jgi:hypothetical protein
MANHNPLGKHLYGSRLPNGMAISSLIGPRRRAKPGKNRRARLVRITSAVLFGAADVDFAFAPFNGVASALLVIFNAAIAVWPVVA